MSIEVNGSSTTNLLRHGVVTTSGGGTFDNGVTIVLDSGTDGHEVTSSDDGNRMFANKISSNAGGTLPDGINKIYESAYWELGTTYSAFQTDVTFDLSSISGISNTSNLRILKRSTPDGTWSVYGSFDLVDPTHIRANNLTSFSDFAIGTIGSDALPVELTSFTATSTSSATVELNWETATEVNNYGFAVERKSSFAETGKSKDSPYCWTQIGFIDGSGNSNSPKQYSFIDSKTTEVYNNLGGFNGVLQYRLKQIDNDGTFKYSNIVEVAFNLKPTTFELFQNYPNPFNPSTVIRYQIPEPVTVTLKVFDMLGNEVATVVKENQPAGNYSITFDGSNLTSGVYFYKLQAGKFAEIKKFILMK